MRHLRVLSVLGLLAFVACTARQPPQAPPQGPADAPPPGTKPVPPPDPGAPPASETPPVFAAPPGSPPKTPRSTDCPAKRPEICTQQYQPVCANVDTGVRCIKAPCPSEEQKEFSNWCVACTNPKVRSYVEGACPGGGPRPSPESMPQ